MGSITDMGLYVWDGATDPYNKDQLAQNWEILTFHDHTPGRGAQITSGALAPGSVGSGNFDTTAQSYIQAASHLKYIFVNTLPFTASDGQFVSCGAVGTYSLPAASVANQTITFVNDQFGVATIARSGSDLIYVEGAWGVTTFPLGSTGQVITLQSDGGTSWIARTGPGRLQQGLATVNTTIAQGQFLVVSPGVTITLPSPKINAVCGIMANGAVTGASPVTVTGTSIYGVGLNAASSYLLGTAVACTVLQSDGVNWLITSGQQDTGWVNLTLTAGWTNAGTQSAAARRLGDRVWLRGMVGAPASSQISGTLFATVTNSLLCPIGGGSNINFPIASFNQISVSTLGFNVTNVAGTAFFETANGPASLPSNGEISLDGFSYVGA